jgi:hypothetical protein
MQGLLIVFDESGNELRRATATVAIPASLQSKHTTTTRANAHFTVAFKTSDGGYLAFGTFRNYDAALTEKQYDWGTESYSGSQWLINGAWIVKFNSNLQVVTNTLVRGRHIQDGWVTNANQFLIGGFDAQNASNQDINEIMINLTLLRTYDHNGNLINDFRQDNREINALYKYPDGSFVAATPDRLLSINAAVNSATSTTLTTTILPGATNPYVMSVSPISGGGVFVNTYLHNENVPSLTYTNGVGLYKLNSSNNHVYHKNDIPAATIYSAPYLLPGATTKYVGTATYQTA